MRFILSIGVTALAAETFDRLQWQTWKGPLPGLGWRVIYAVNFTERAMA